MNGNVHIDDFLSISRLIYFVLKSEMGPLIKL